jgi:hypothetical protein
MARILANIPDTEAPSSDYPKGKVLNQDNTANPPIPGTPILEEIYGDIIQFFKKLVGLASITENDLPDNESNGYQYVSALEDFVNDEITERTGTTEGKIPTINANWYPLRFVITDANSKLQATPERGIAENNVLCVDADLTPGQTVKVGTTGLISEDLGDVLKTKIIEIGDWNMDTTQNALIAHGLTEDKIRTMQVLIIPDSGAGRLPIQHSDYLGAVAGGAAISGTNIVLSRTNGGLFDDPAFSATSFNRGYITIMYVS